MVIGEELLPLFSDWTLVSKEHAEPLWDNSSS